MLLCTIFNARHSQHLSAFPYIVYLILPKNQEFSYKMLDFTANFLCIKRQSLISLSSAPVLEVSAETIPDLLRYPLNVFGKVLVSGNNNGIIKEQYIIKSLLQCVRRSI